MNQKRSWPALVPELNVSMLATSLDFYVRLLGFAVEYERPEESFARLSLGDAHLMLEEAPSLRRASRDEFLRGEWRTADLEVPFGRGLNLELEVSTLEPIAARLVADRYPLLLEPHEKSRRVGNQLRVVRQLLVADPDGYLVRPSEFIEMKPATPSRPFH